MPIRFLVVDETAFVRDALKRALRRFLVKDIEIFDASNGLRAISTLRANKIDLVISSWDLPETSGSELLRWVRESDKYAKTPFVVMSDESGRAMVMKAIEAGASDFLAKPFSPEEVQKKVVKQLAKIGYVPRGHAAMVNTASSLDVLTAGNPPTASEGEAGDGEAAAPAPANPSRKPEIMKPRVIKDAGSSFAKPLANPPKPNSNSSSGGFNGTAHLHFDGFSTRCLLRELSLTGMQGLIERPSAEEMPVVFELAKADIENAKGEPLGSFQVYVHSLQANELRPDCRAIRITCRYMENDPQSFELLSKAIANGG